MTYFAWYYLWWGIPKSITGTAWANVDEKNESAPLLYKYSINPKGEATIVMTIPPGGREITGTVSIPLATVQFTWQWWNRGTVTYVGGTTFTIPSGDQDVTVYPKIELIQTTLFTPQNLSGVPRPRP